MHNKPLRESSTSSSSTSSSSIENRQPHLQIGMIYIADEIEKNSSHQATAHRHPQPPQPRIVYLDDGATTSHPEYRLSDNEKQQDLSGQEEADAHPSWMQDAHRWHHWEDDYWHEWEEREEDEEEE